ncbi:antitoxin VapB family protein [Halomarina pelagica]|uniref:antitoxin VapB family protein n=1 Tax=Halomarina pelagica TaxID=2961599 RepID=UPI0020C3761D|nr:antitoxin VapB family protein [Halomarina sp. BND7]
MSKTIRVPNRVYERIKAHQQEHESVGETLDRLVGGRSLRELSGVLTDEEGETMREAITASERRGNRDLDDLVERIEQARESATEPE